MDWTSGGVPSKAMTLDDAVLKNIQWELMSGRHSKGRRISERFVLAALGSIPAVGTFIAAAAAIPGIAADAKRDDLRTLWLEEHARIIARLQETIDAIFSRFDQFGEEIQDRIESEEYLALVRQAFRVWDESETEEKRQYVANVVTNAAGGRVCSDDVVRLFISWLGLFHEAHFAIISEIHQNPGSTRFEIWTALYREMPREDSAEADMFRMLVRDLSTAGVIRQARDTTEAGEFLRRTPSKKRRAAPRTMKSSFDDEAQYMLTSLGKNFVHYTLMSEVRRIEGSVSEENIDGSDRCG